MTELTRHISHRAFLKDERHLRCVDCSQTVVLPAPIASTSTSQHPHPDAQCPKHRGEPAGHCGRCRSEQIEADGRPRPPRQAASPEAIAEARRLYEQARRARAEESA
jgi:hypothetical protein